MRIDGLSSAPLTLREPAPQPAAASDPIGSFSDVLRDAVAEVNRLQQAGDEQARLLATGKAEDLHQVMLSLEEARMAVQLLVQARNKVLEAYQEVMRTQL